MTDPLPEPRDYRVLIDVDVILDVFARREPFFADSAALVAACERSELAGVVAAHTITTLSFLLTKYHDEAYAREKLADLLKIVDVAAVDRQVIYAALTLEFADLDDAVQVCAGAAAAADYIVTHDLKDFSRGPLPAIAPTEFLPLLPRLP